MIAQESLDRLWDFDDPAAFERRFAEAAADPRLSATERAELVTQRARALGLQGRFDEARALLEALAVVEEPVVRVRTALEAGRLHNSAGRSAQASLDFDAARTEARAAGLDFLEIDALHMLAIADAAHAEDWARHGIERAEAAGDVRTQRWLVSLHNNLGWSRLRAGDLDGALTSFRECSRWADAVGTPEQRGWAAEAIAECEAAISDRRKAEAD